MTLHPSTSWLLPVGVNILDIFVAVIDIGLFSGRSRISKWEEPRPTAIGEDQGAARGKVRGGVSPPTGGGGCARPPKKTRI